VTPSSARKIAGAMIDFSALCLFAFQSAAPADPAKDITSNDASVRLAAARTIAEKGHPDAEHLLTKALDDEDWEIAIVAATELGEQEWEYFEGRGLVRVPGLASNA